MSFSGRRSALGSATFYPEFAKKFRAGYPPFLWLDLDGGLVRRFTDMSGQFRFLNAQVMAGSSPTLNGPSDQFFFSSRTERAIAMVALARGASR